MDRVAVAKPGENKHGDDSESCDLIQTRPGGFFDVCLNPESTCAHKILAMGFTYVDQGQVMVAGRE